VKKPSPPKRVKGQEFPKDRCKRTFMESGTEAAGALGKELGIPKGKLERWLKEFEGKAVKTAKPAKSETETATRRPHSPYFEHETREDAERHRANICKRAGMRPDAFHIFEQDGRFCVMPAHTKKDPPPQFEDGDWVMDTVIPDTLGRIVKAGPYQSEVRYEKKRNGYVDRNICISNSYLYKVEAPAKKKSKRA
jgi:hypothetical protein